MFLILFYLIGALGLSFLCSVLEAVLLSTPMSFISMKEAEGSKVATTLKNFKNNIDLPEAAILSLNTIAHTIGAAGVGSESVKIFGEEYFGIISAILTLLILVLSEIIPKTIGATYWRSLAIPSTTLIRFMIIALYPLVILSELITKLFASRNHQVSVSREEVSAMVNVGMEEGVFQAKESKAIQSFLKLANVKAKEIMTPSSVVECSDENTTLGELYKDSELIYSRIPVYVEDDVYITGYILKSVVLDEVASDNFNMRIAEIVRPILSFGEDEKVSDIWEKMIETKEHISVINDEYGCFRGIITMEDVIETMLGVEIVDENDVADDMQVLAREQWEQAPKRTLEV